MARIRSVHPGFATDEDFVTVSRDARLFYLLLLTECDDQGVFDWKPLTLKMRLFPADTIDIETLLSELAKIDALTSYEIDGRKLGAVRNFRKFQRPKSPNAIHPVSDDIRIYVGLSLSISEIDEHEPPQIPPKAEKSPQMEEGGGRMKGKGGGDSGSPPRARRSALSAEELEEFDTWYRVYPKHEARGHAEQAFAKARKIATIEDLMTGAKRYAERADHRENGRFIKQPATWLNAKCWLDDQAATPAAPEVTPLFSEEERRRNQQEARIRGYRTNGLWLSEWGPKPDDVSRETA